MSERKGVMPMPAPTARRTGQRSAACAGAGNGPSSTTRGIELRPRRRWACLHASTSDAVQSPATSMMKLAVGVGNGTTSERVSDSELRRCGGPGLGDVA